MEENNVNGDTRMTVTLPHYEKIRKATMVETYQYFKKLIETKSIKNLHECIDPSTELTVFDESLRLLLIDCLKLEKEVLKIFLSHNENQIKGVLKCNWFFQNLSADFCTKHIFPYVSLSLRCKIINKLSKHLESEEEAEKYFAFIRDNYENSRANYILPRCSPEFIVAYVEKEKPPFDQNTGLRILLNISKRFPELGVHILSTIFEMKKGDPYNFRNYKKIMHYLAGYYPDLMVPFLKKYISVIPSELFGRKLTKKLVRKLQENLFPEFVKNLIFKEKILFSIIGFEHKVKFLAEVVRSFKDQLSYINWVRSDNQLAYLLKLVPQDKRQELINIVFKEVYNVSFFDYPKCWSTEVLEVLPTETRRLYAAKLEEFAEAGVNVFQKTVGHICFSPDYPENYLYLYDSHVAFDKFRELLRKTPDVSKRETILRHLVKSCWISKDHKVLEEVVEFVASRHRNDDHTVIFSFMRAILDHFPISSLNSNIFEKLDDLAYFCYLKDREKYFAYCEWLEKHIFHRLENGLDVDNHIKRFFESGFIRSYHGTFVRDFKLKHAKSLILLLCKEAVNWFESKSTGNDTEEFLMLQSMLKTFKEYNELNRRDRIFMREIPGLEEILRKKTKETFSDVDWEEWSLDIWEKYYSDVTNEYYKPRCLLFILKRRPDLIEKHLEGILKIMYSKYFREYNEFFIFLIKTVSFYGKTEKMKEMILNEFQNGKSIRERKTALLLYSQVCTIDEFSKAVEPYLPKQEKLERGSDEAFNEIQMSVPTLIKNIKPRHKNLELVFKFFLGDYLKSVLPSLYTCCCNTPSNVVIPFLRKQLEKVPPKVSYVKDIARLILILSDKRGRMEFFQECWETHEHYSVRSIVLRFVSEFFLERPNEESFQILEKCILDCDEMTAAALPDLYDIPETFFNQYVIVLWKFSDTQKKSFKINFRRGLLTGFSSNNINFLSEEFCESLIKSHLFDDSSEFPVNEFAAIYMTAKPDDMENRFFMVLNLVQDRKPTAESVYKFFNILIEKSVQRPSEFADLFTVMLKNWPEYPVGVLYHQRLLFTYHNAYQRVLKRGCDGDNSFVEFGRELKKLFAGVENLNDLLPMYVECLKEFLGRHETPKVILTLKELVAGSQDRSVAVLAVLCMPREAVDWYTKKRINGQQNIVKNRKELDEFVKIVEGYCDSIVQMYLNSKFEFVK